MPFLPAQKDRASWQDSGDRVTIPSRSRDTTAELLTGCLDWLAARVHWFDPEHWGRFLAPRPFPCGPLAELLVLCRILRRGHHRDHPLRQRALDLAVRQADTPAFADGLSRSDLAFAYHVYLVALLHDEGFVLPRARTAIQTQLDLGCGDHTAPSRGVQQLLELSYILDLGRFRTDLPGASELVPRSIAADPPSPLWARDDEAYAVTHVIFYATDFGARPMPPVPRLTAFCRTLLGTYLAHRNLDLAGEFLLCLDALAPTDTTATHTTVTDTTVLSSHGWHVLAGMQELDGAVPGPLFDPTRAGGLDGERAEAYRFGTCHHTTMVTALAAAVRQGRRAG